MKTPHAEVFEVLRAVLVDEVGHEHRVVAVAQVDTRAYLDAGPVESSGVVADQRVHPLVRDLERLDAGKNRRPAEYRNRIIAHVDREHPNTKCRVPHRERVRFDVVGVRRNLRDGFHPLPDNFGSQRVEIRPRHGDLSERAADLRGRKAEVLNDARRDLRAFGRLQHRRRIVRRQDVGLVARGHACGSERGAHPIGKLLLLAALFCNALNTDDEFKRCVAEQNKHFRRELCNLAHEVGRARGHFFFRRRATVGRNALDAVRYEQVVAIEARSGEIFGKKIADFAGDGAARRIVVLVRVLADDHDLRFGNAVPFAGHAYR